MPLPTASVNKAVAVTQIGGSKIEAPEPAAVNLTLTTPDSSFPAASPPPSPRPRPTKVPGPSPARASPSPHPPAGPSRRPAVNRRARYPRPETSSWTVTASNHYQIGTTESIAATLTYTDTATGQREMTAAAISRTPGPVAVTFRTRAPAGTPPDATLYLPGRISQLGPWDPGKVAMTNEGGGIWQTTVTITDGTDVQYKYTRGSWNTVENWGSIAGTINRDVTINGGATGTMLVDDTSTAWSDATIPDDHKAPQFWRDPLVVATTPADGSTGAAPAAVTITFHGDIEPTGADYSESVTATLNNTAVAGTTTKTAPGVLTWQPTVPLPAGTYHLTVDNLASNNNGDSVPINEPYQFTFTVS